MEVHFDYEDEGEDLVTLQQIYKKFLIGSEKCEKLELNSYDQLQTVAQVAISHPQSLQQLREVNNGGYILGSLLYANDRPEIDDLFEDYFKVIQISYTITQFYANSIFQFFFELLTCCHNLEKVVITLPSDERYKPAKENRYLATIQAIDPDVIEILEEGSMMPEDRYWCETWLNLRILL